MKTSALDEAGAYYIVGAKLKQLPAALQTKVLDGQLIRHSIKAHQASSS